jgi:hypothetical protein
MSFNNCAKLEGSRADDEPVSAQEADTRRWVEGNLFPVTLLPPCDELPGAHGPFGTSVDNPIPVNGPKGQTAYLNRLRSKSGVGFFYHRLGSTTSSVGEVHVDLFELVSIDAAEWYRLYFSMYHPRRSTVLPEGLAATPWSCMNELERVACKMDTVGSHFPIDCFPLGLPEHIRHSRSLEAISPGLGDAMARRMQGILYSHPGRWDRPGEVAPAALPTPPTTTPPTTTPPTTTPPMAEPAGESARAIVDEARRRGLGVDDGRVPMIPAILDSIFMAGSMCMAIFRSLKREHAEEVVRRSFGFLFGKAVEAALQWSRSPDGKIDLGLKVEALIRPSLETSLPPELHVLAAAAAGESVPYFQVHQRIMRERQGSMSDDEFGREIRTTIQYIPMLAYLYAVGKGYHVRRGQG